VAELADRGKDEDLVVIRYFVDPREWPGRPPRLCEIIHHHGLGLAAAGATLHLNRKSSGCASADQAVVQGEHILVAVWAPPEFDQCQERALRCP
jgi:hypothetical protein